MSNLSKCGICGDKLSSLEALSMHQCTVTLNKAYDDAFRDSRAHKETEDLIRFLHDACRLADYVLTQLDLTKADMGDTIQPILREAIARAKRAA